MATGRLFRTTGPVDRRTVWNAAKRRRRAANAVPELTPLQRILALSPSALWWPQQGAGWQGTSGGTLSAAGQPVGLVPDLAALGGKTLAEWLAAPTTSDLVTNGALTASLTGWTQVNDSGATAVAGASGVTITSSGANVARIRQAPSVTSGKAYVVSFELVSGTCQFDIWGTGYGSGSLAQQLNYSTVGVRTFVVSATSANLYVQLSSVSSTSGVVTNISVRELPGNHLRAGTWPLPSDPARGTYGRVPKTGRRNLCLHTEAITIANNWTTPFVSGATRTDGAITLTASEGYLYIARTGNAVTGTLNTVSFDAVCDTTVNNVPFRASSGAGGAYQLVNMVAGVSQRITMAPFTPSATQLEIGIDARDAIVPGGSNATGYTVTLNRIQTEVGSTATPYQKVTTALDVTEAGVADTYYIQPDAINDSMGFLNALSARTIIAAVRVPTNYTANDRFLTNDAETVNVSVNAGDWTNTGTGSTRINKASSATFTAGGAFQLLTIEYASSQAFTRLWFSATGSQFGSMDVAALAVFSGALSSGDRATAETVIGGIIGV